MLTLSFPKFIIYGIHTRCLAFPLLYPFLSFLLTLLSCGKAYHNMFLYSVSFLEKHVLRLKCIVFGNSAIWFSPSQFIYLPYHTLIGTKILSNSFFIRMVPRARKEPTKILNGSYFEDLFPYFFLLNCKSEGVS